MGACQVLVVGAGPTGLTLACCLARQGVDVRIIEQQHEPPSMARGSRGTAYQVRTLEVFDDLGVLDLALADAWTDMPTRIYREGELVADLSRVARDLRPTPEVPHPTMARPLQTWRVEQILWGRLEELGVKVEVGTEVADLEQDDDGVSVFVRAAAPEAGGWGRSTAPNRREQPAPPDRSGTTVVRAEYVVGCDGGRSVVRRAAGLAYESRRNLGFAGMIADLHVDGIEPTYMRMWFGPDGHEVVLSPQPTTRNFQFIAQMEPDAEGEFPEPSVELAQRLFDERAGIPGVRLHDVTWQSFFKVRESLADHYRAGRALVAGDAAHLHSPLGGLGANSGIQDAYNLGWKLAYVVQGVAPASLLDTYEQERRPVAEEVLRSSGDAHASVFDRLPPAATAAADPLAVVQDRSLADWMSQLGVSYPETALSGGSRAPSWPSLGDRAPDGRVIDATTGQRLRLFDLFRGGHLTLLLFGGDPEVLAAGADAVRRHAGVLRACALKDVDDRLAWDGETYVDPHGRAAAAYQADLRPVVLVRPDGYLAFHGDAGSGPALLDHLSAFLREG